MSSVVNYRRKIIKLSKQISKKKDQRLAKEHWKILEKITNLSESVRELRSSMVKTVCVRISTKLHLLPPPHFFMNELTSQRHAAPSMTSTTTRPTPTAAEKPHDQKRGRCRSSWIPSILLLLLLLPLTRLRMTNHPRERGREGERGACIVKGGRESEGG